MKVRFLALRDTVRWIASFWLEPLFAYRDTIGVVRPVACLRLNHHRLSIIAWAMWIEKAWTDTLLNFCQVSLEYTPYLYFEAVSDSSWHVWNLWAVTDIRARDQYLRENLLLGIAGPSELWFRTNQQLGSITYVATTHVQSVTQWCHQHGRLDTCYKTGAGKNAQFSEPLHQ